MPQIIPRTTKHTQLSDVATPHSDQLEIVSETTVGTAATQVDITGLDLDTDKVYLVYIAFLNAHATNAASLSLYFNDDTTATNYYRQYLAADHSSVSGARTNTGIFVDAVPAGDAFTGYGYIRRDVLNYPRASMESSSRDAAAVFLNTVAHIWNSATNPTKINLVANQTNAIGVGTVIIIFKVTA